MSNSPHQPKREYASWTRLGLLLIGMGLLASCFGGRKDVNRRGEIKLRGEKPVVVDRRQPGDLLQTGIASWYGHPYHGRKTANGETYNMNLMTAAHKTLPFNTLVRVKYGTQSVVVRINDRGPFVRGRVIDLSREAAKRLGLLAAGTGKVSLFLASGDSGSVYNRGDDRGRGRGRGHSDRARDRSPVVTSREIGEPSPQDSSNGFWTVQVGSFSEKPRAEAMKNRMSRYHRDVFVQYHRRFYRVRVGNFHTKREAADFAAYLFESGQDCWVTFHTEN